MTTHFAGQPKDLSPLDPFPLAFLRMVPGYPILPLTLILYSHPIQNPYIQNELLKPLQLSLPPKAFYPSNDQKIIPRETISHYIVLICSQTSRPNLRLRR